MSILYGALVSLFGSKLKADEVLYLLNGEKKVLRQLFSLSELSEIESFCQEHSLFLVRSCFKIVVADTNKAFSNKGFRVPVQDPRNGLFVVYVSSDERLANLAALAEQQGNDSLLGELLGYPACCVEYFCKNFSSKTSNPELRQSHGLKNADSFLLDISLRPEDIALLSHFPCSWGCVQSVEIAENRLLLLEKTHIPRARELFEKLCSINKIERFK